MDAPATIDTVVFDNSLVPEASGIVPGRRHPDVFWIVDDATSDVVAIDSTGVMRAQVTLTGVDARDIEDIAVGPCGADDPSPCIYVADIGDNLDSWPSVQVYRFPEPDLGVGPIEVSTVEVSTATYVYADGPRNAEAMIIDAAGRPIVISKEEDVAGVYVAPSFADGVLSRVGDLPLPEPEFPLLTDRAGLSVTAADLSPDAARVLLRTYSSILELTAPAGPVDLATLGTWEQTEVPSALERQGEAVAYTADGIDYVTVSEGSDNLSRFDR